MKVCPSCGRENAEDALYCSRCATALEPEAAAREERKVVTCLFCDLVGFTARAERMDPEDVRRLLQPYHARVRSELERFGGTVEKFIGDAVMAVFGAPVAHEDDPERAVRAALSIRDTLAEEGELEVRIGITTGEALVALGSRPDAGEGMASGDVVNTAARLQTAAPTNGVLVDETTYRATDRAIEYAEPRSIEAKGKADPIPAREALKARALVSVERVGGADLVGRQQELTLLRETLARVVREREPQLVTLVGVPGIGKSRLVYELFQTIETGHYGLVYWRHGRSLPYGEGVTFWALGEMVKAQAGILESDTSDPAGEKLRQAVARFVDDATDAVWIERHLRPLAGLETDETPADDRREESFAAWRRFVEAIADERPLVLVFEDLHWADDALLDFVDYLVEWAKGVPLLALCTARPELLSRRATWGGGKVNSATILVSPLSETETAALVHELLGRAPIEAGLHARLLEHAGGNPLYAEEFTRMQLERPADAVLPESVQGMIAARLDTLTADEKELLQDAAVVGRVFWLGALGQERPRVQERLHALERKEFVSRQRRSAVASEEEYSFRHVLVRDVAYEQIPRAQRADKHRLAAEWIESLGRTEDHAEMLAHHYAAALDYARAAGRESGVLAERGGRALRDAGDRAFALNAFVQAGRFYQRALELWPEDERGELLLRYGRTLSLAADERCMQVLLQAAEELGAAGDREATAEAHAFLTEAFQQQGERDAAYAHIEKALALVGDAPPSAEKARVLAESSRLLVLGGRHTEGLPVALESYEMAEGLGLTELAARALGNVAIARASRHEYREAVADQERCIELGLSVNSPEAGRGYHNLVASLWALGELPRAVSAGEQAVTTLERLGALRMRDISRCVVCWAHYYACGWHRALELAEAIIAECEAGSSLYYEYQPRLARARIRLARAGDETLVLEDVRRAIEIGRAAKDPAPRAQTLSHATLVSHELGRLDDARTTATEFVEFLTVREVGTALSGAADTAWVAEALGFAEVLRHALSEVLEPVWREPYEAVLDRDFDQAAEQFAALNCIEEGRARLEAGAKLLEEGRGLEAQSQLQRAIAFHRPLGATRYVRQAEELLAGAGLEVSA